MSRKILIIDDDVEVLNVTCKFLENYNYDVKAESNSSKGTGLAKSFKPDCIVLDYMMPDMDGLRVCRTIRTFSNTPIIFLTGKGDEKDKLAAFREGADDYIIKPYSLYELQARIDVILRRSGSLKTKSPSQSSSEIRYNDLIIDLLAHNVSYKSEELSLTNREYEMFLYLARNPEKEISFEELGTILFGNYQQSDRSSLMVNMSRLRKKLTSITGLENVIETVWSKGYKFIQP
ncbi:response regulator transcription factor [Lachnospiraceae bacterium OttesenSCG-928-D06]|nr:response regulator transcription factor [Lachnospiraceae bacterium OttesenSCG-928-D06]